MTEEKKTTYVCTLDVLHNKEGYVPGDKVELTAKEADQLLQAGAVKKVIAKSSAQTSTKKKETGSKKKTAEETTTPPADETPADASEETENTPEHPSTSETAIEEPWEEITVKMIDKYASDHKIDFGDAKKKQEKIDVLLSKSIKPEQVAQ